MEAPACLNEALGSKWGLCMKLLQSRQAIAHSLIVVGLAIAILHAALSCNILLLVCVSAGAVGEGIFIYQNYIKPKLQQFKE